MEELSRTCGRLGALPNRSLRMGSLASCATATAAFVSEGAPASGPAASHPLENPALLNARWGNPKRYWTHYNNLKKAREYLLSGAK